MRPAGRQFVTLVLLAAVIPTGAAAQDASTSPSRVGRNACLDAVPDSSLRRVPVYVSATPQDSLAQRREVLNAIDLVTQSIALAGRALLGAAENTLPSGEPTVTWRGIDGRVRIVARRDGSFEGRLQPPEHPGEVSSSDAGPRFVVRALDAARAAGDRFFLPDSTPTDSVAWTVELERSVLTERGEIVPPKVRLAIPVFAMLSPAERQVSAERVRVSYPPRLRSSGLMGNVMMQFVVDTTGHVDLSTVRDLFPAGHPPLKASDQAAYDEFIRAIRVGLQDARYRPARIGGCLVRQLVQQPFSFKLGGGWADR